MDMYSPSKRRALAPLDANAKPTLTPKHHKLERPTTFPGGAAPLRLFPEGSSRKRGLEDAGVEGLGGKKACLSRDEVRFLQLLRMGEAMQCKRGKRKLMVV